MRYIFPVLFLYFDIRYANKIRWMGSKWFCCQSSFLFWFAYFVGLEAFHQATPGHDIFKLKIVKLNGEKIGFMNALKRRICDPVDILLYGIPAIICITKTEKHQRIGDLFASTIVIRKEDVTEIDFSIR